MAPWRDCMSTLITDFPLVSHRPFFPIFASYFFRFSPALWLLSCSWYSCLIFVPPLWMKGCLLPSLRLMLYHLKESWPCEVVWFQNLTAPVWNRSALVWLCSLCHPLGFSFKINLLVVVDVALMMHLVVTRLVRIKKNRQHWSLMSLHDKLYLEYFALFHHGFCSWLQPCLQFCVHCNSGALS